MMKGLGVVVAASLAAAPLALAQTDSLPAVGDPGKRWFPMAFSHAVACETTFVETQAPFDAYSVIYYRGAPEFILDLERAKVYSIDRYSRIAKEWAWRDFAYIPACVRRNT